MWGGWAVVAAALAALAAVVLAQAGCSSETVPSQTINPCGAAAGDMPAMECISVKQCGAGAQNYVEVAFCEHCFARSDTHVCEEGACRALDSELTNINFNFLLPASAMGAKSFAIASVIPVTAEGSSVTCASLKKSGCNFINNATLNARNSRANALPSGGDFVTGQISIDPGEDRILFIQLTSDLQGKGTVLATGCKDGIDVVKGTTPPPVEITFD